MITPNDTEPRALTYEAKGEGDSVVLVRYTAETERESLRITVDR